MQKTGAPQAIPMNINTVKLHPFVVQILNSTTTFKPPPQKLLTRQYCLYLCIFDSLVMAQSNAVPGLSLMQEYKKSLDFQTLLLYYLENNEVLLDYMIWYFLGGYSQNPSWHVFYPDYPTITTRQPLNKEKPENLLFIISVPEKRQILGYLNRKDCRFIFYGFLPPGNVQNEAKKIMNHWLAVQKFPLAEEYEFNHIV